MKTKKCFKTKRKLLLFMFQKDSSKYQLKSDLGRCKICRICNIRHAIKEGGIFNRFEGKYTFRTKSKWQIIKHYLLEKY